MSFVIKHADDYKNKRSKRLRRCTLVTQTKRGQLEKLCLYSQESPLPYRLYRAQYIPGQRFTYNGLFKIWDVHSGGDTCQFAGSIVSPGWLSTKSIFENQDNEGCGGILYETTSRDGSLMNMEVLLPNVIPETPKTLASNECFAETRLPTNIVQLVTEFVGDMTWYPSLKDLTKDTIADYSEEEKIIKFRNKKPVWNSEIGAYTLEFDQRAKLPSVHNFQLVRSDGKSKSVILQLGKVAADRFNVDYSYPLTTFQAFSICISVIQRTFVHD